MIDAGSIDAKLELKNFLLSLDKPLEQRSLRAVAKKFRILYKKLSGEDFPVGIRFISKKQIEGKSGIYEVRLLENFDCKFFGPSGPDGSLKGNQIVYNGITFFNYLSLLCGNNPFSSTIRDYSDDEDFEICFPRESFGFDTPLMKILRSMGIGE